MINLLSKDLGKPSIIGNYTYYSEITGMQLGASDKISGIYHNGINYDTVWRSVSNTTLVTDYATTNNLKDFTEYVSNPVFDITNGSTILRSFVRACYFESQSDGSVLIYGFYCYPKGDGETDLCLATSTDFINWTDLGIIRESEVDEPGGIYAASCIKVNGVLYVFCSVANQFEQSTALYDVKAYSSATPLDVNSYQDEGVIIPRSGGAAGTHLSSIIPMHVDYCNAKFELIINDADNYNKIYGFRSDDLLSGYVEIQQVYQDFLTNEGDYVQFQEEVTRSLFYFDPATNRWHLYYALRDVVRGLSNVQLVTL